MIERASRALVLGALLVACGGPPAPPDAGAPPIDGGEAPGIDEPTPPALTPCPPGWREGSDASGATVCDPWPEGGMADCAQDEAHFPGTPGCVRIGTACPADGWPAGLPTDRPIVYVDGSAAVSGDGTSPEQAVRSVAEGLDVAPAGAVVAIARGRYAEGPLVVRGDRLLVGACVSETELTAAETGPEPLLELADGALRNLAIDLSDRVSVGVRSGAASVEDVVIRGARFAVMHHGGALTLRRVALRDGRAEADGTEGRALDIGYGARLVLETVVIQGTPQFGLWAGGPGTSVDARDLAVLDTLPQASDLAHGRGLYVDDGARLTVERAVIERARGYGVLAHGAGTRFEARDLVVRDVETLESTGRLGRGVGVEVGATATLDRVWIAEARETGLSVLDGGDATVRDAVVARTLGEAATGTFGRGVSVARGSHAVIERLLVAESREAALLVGGVGSRVEATDVVMRAVEPRASTGDFGGGAWVQDGAALGLGRARVEQTYLVGILAITGASVELSSVVVRDTRASLCTDASCAARAEGAYGLIALYGGSLRAERFLVERSALCGVVVGETADVGPPTAVDLVSGEIRGAPVGACVQIDGYDPARLQDDVQYRDVDVPLQATSYALPTEL